jgi:hypothetical protein
MSTHATSSMATTYIEAMSAEEPTTSVTAPSPGTLAPDAATSSPAPYEGRSPPEHREPEGSRATATTAEEIKERLIALDFEVHKSIRYHAKRRSFFDNCNNLTRAISAIFAAGAIVSIVGGSYLATIVVAALLAVISAVDLVIDFSRRARVYDDLYREFCELSANIEENPVCGEEHVRMFAAQKLRIQAKEPTGLDVLNVICANEELEGRGYDYKYRIRWWQSLLRHFISLPPSTFPKVRSPIGEITHTPA